MVQDFFERGDAAVMHIGRGEGDVAERGSFEAAEIGGPAGVLADAAVGRGVIGVEGGVVKRVVG
jgi:hypothetical protein